MPSENERQDGREYYYERPAEGVLRILSYNVRNCIGMDGKTDFDRVADVINRINPDVVAIQELDSATQRLGGVFVLELLAEKTGMHYVYGPAIDYQGGKYGNGVLSREKPVGYSSVPLPGRQERRSLLMVEYSGFFLFATHFNNAHPGDRHGAALITNYEARNAEKPIFLAGDINDTPGSRTLELLSERWIQLSGNEFTVGSNNPVRCIDFIFGVEHPGFEYQVKQQVVVNEPVASDHLPVFIDVVVKK